MALLIVLAVIGGLVGLIALYVLATYLVAAVVGHTKLFAEKVNDIIEGYKARRSAKRAAKAKTKAEEVPVEEAEKEQVEEVQEVTEEPIQEEVAAAVRDNLEQ